MTTTIQPTPKTTTTPRSTAPTRTAAKPAEPKTREFTPRDKVSVSQPDDAKSKDVTPLQDGLKKNFSNPAGNGDPKVDKSEEMVGPDGHHRLPRVLHDPNDPSSPADPSPGITDADRDEDGKVKTGTLFNEVSDIDRNAPQAVDAKNKFEAAEKAERDAETSSDPRARIESMFAVRDAGQNLNQALQSTISHKYAVRTALPEGVTLDQANDYLNRFNAPATAALDGTGNDPTLTHGYVDPAAIQNNAFTRTASWLTGQSENGGHVDMYRGTTEDGRNWVQNSTINGEHPLIGHIVRTIEHDDATNRYYVRTDGTGGGRQDTDNAAARHALNSVLGPDTFKNLDAAMVETMNRELFGK